MANQTISAITRNFDDAAMSGAPYSGITVAYYTANQTRTIGGASYNFKVIVAGNGATLEQIYTKLQYLLRQATDINTGGTAGTDKAVTLIGIRPGYGKFAVATGTLSRSKGISLSLVGEQDRVYAS